MHNLKSLATDTLLRLLARSASACVILTLATAATHAAAPVWQGPDGGDFLDPANWTVQLPGPADTAVVNNEFEGTIPFSNSITTMDFYLRSQSGKVTLDVDPNDAGNKFTISRNTIVGAAAGESNHLLVKSGELQSGIVFVGNAAGAENNTLELSGADTNWLASASTAAIRVGSNGGSNSSLLIHGGARLEGTTQTIIGLQGASNGLLEVSGAGSEFYNAQSISLGDNIAADKPEQTNNQLKVLNGGHVSTRELIIGTTLRSPNNTVTVSGPGSRLTVRGGQQANPQTEGGQLHDVGRASSNNRLIVENGGAVDGNAIFQLGRETTSLNNFLSLTDASLTGWGVEINQGKVLIERSSLNIDRKLDALITKWLGGSLFAETPQAEIDFRSGTLSTVNAIVTNGSVLTIGDGSGPSATYVMKTNPQTNANGAHSFADGLALASNGILAGNGNITGNVSGSAGSKVDVGASAGVINVTGDWNNTGVDIELELDNIAASTAAGVQFDQLNITGAFTHGGSVNIDLAQLVVPASPTPLKLIGWSSEVGASSSTAVTFLNGAALPFAFQADGLYVTVEASANLAGDYNSDGRIDAADYTVWRDSLGAATLTNRGAGITGPVGTGDYDFWKSHFGEGMGSGAAAGAAIPEPTTACLIFSITILAGNVRSRARRRLRPVGSARDSLQERLKNYSPALIKSLREAKLEA
jgi:hypothetical protein